MNKDNVNQVLDALAARLAVPVSHLWHVLVVQAAIEFWSVFAFAVFSTAMLLLCYRGYKNAPKGTYDPTFPQLMFGIGLLLSSIGVCIALIFVFGEAGYLVNPEYYALKEVLGAFK